MAGEILDWVALVYAGTVAVLIVGGLPLYIRHRHDHVVKARNVPMLVVMSVGAVFHIVSEMVSNRHLEVLTQLETLACPLWGYWMPYVLGAGLFFTGLYLRLFTYTSAISRDFTERAAACALRMRVPIAMMTLFPITSICVLATIMPGGSHVTEGHCTSESGYKLAVGAWMSLCILVLISSVAVFRTGFVSDIVGETSKQFFVAGLGLVVLVAVGFVFIFAESGLNEVWNRFLATFSIATLYLWALGVLGLRPVWRVVRGDASYRRVFEEKVDKMQQPLESVVRVIERSNSKEINRLIVADFLLFCADPVRYMMDRGRDLPTNPSQVVTFYSMLDAWTQQTITASAMDPENEDYAIIFQDMPPLVSEDIVRTPNEIIGRYFTNEGAPGYINLYIDGSVQTKVTKKHMIDNDPVDTFKDAMWWALRLLDEFYGEAYIDVHIRGREVFQKDGVEELLNELRLEEGRRRIEAAQLVPVRTAVPTDSEDSSPSSSDGGVAVELEDGTTTDTHQNLSSSDPDDDGLGPWPATNGVVQPNGGNAEMWKTGPGGTMYLSENA
jgi:hypothetical protein